MLKIFIAFFILLKASFSYSLTEADRRHGYETHLKESKKENKKRMEGLDEYLKEVSDWEKMRQKDLEAYRKNLNKKNDQTEHRQKVQDYKKYQESEKKWILEHEQARKEFIKKRERTSSSVKGEKWSFFELQELGLDINRPRYDFRKRFNFTPSNKSSQSLGGASRGGDNYSSGYGTGSAPGAGSGSGSGNSNNNYNDFDNFNPPPNYPIYEPPPFDDTTAPPPFPESEDGGLGSPMNPPPPPMYDGVDF